MNMHVKRPSTNSDAQLQFLYKEWLLKLKHEQECEERYFEAQLASVSKWPTRPDKPKLSNLTTPNEQELNTQLDDYHKKLISWRTDCLITDVTHRLDVLEDEYRQSGLQRDRIEEQIVKLPVRSIRGVLIKLKIWKHHGPDFEEDDFYDAMYLNAFSELEALVSQTHKPVSEVG